MQILNCSSTLGILTFYFYTQKRGGCEIHAGTEGNRSRVNSSRHHQPQTGRFFKARMRSHAGHSPDASLTGSQCKSASLSFIHPHSPLSKSQLCTSTPRQNRSEKKINKVMIWIVLVGEIQFPQWLTLGKKRKLNAAEGTSGKEPTKILKQ